jgi:hypothetical protein
MVVPAAPPEGTEDSLYGLAEDEPQEHPVPAAPSSARSGQGQAARCPDCGAALPGGAVLCVQCGYNVQTGKRLGTRVDGGLAEETPVASAASLPPSPARPASTAGGQSPYPGVPAPRAAAKEPEGSSPVRKILIPVALVVVLIGAIIGGKALLKGGGNAKTPASGIGDDPEVAQLSDSDGAHEARQWLDGPERRMIAGMARHQAKGWVDRWYSWGAGQILCFGENICDRVAVQLPPEPQKRKQFFDFAKQWHEERFFKVVPDQGQKYLLIRMTLSGV